MEVSYDHEEHRRTQNRLAKRRSRYRKSGIQKQPRCKPPSQPSGIARPKDSLTDERMLPAANVEQSNSCLNDIRCYRGSASTSVFETQWSTPDDLNLDTYGEFPMASLISYTNQSMTSETSSINRVLSTPRIEVEEIHDDLLLGDERHGNADELLCPSLGLDSPLPGDQVSPLYTTLPDMGPHERQYTDTSTSIAPQEFSDHTEVRHPLQMASMNGRLISVRLLLHLGADTSARDGYGRTAAHLAVMHGHQDVLQLLLCHGSDPGAVDIAGNTPLSLAATNGLNKAIMLLVEWGAKLQ